MVASAEDEQTEECDTTASPNNESTSATGDPDADPDYSLSDDSCSGTSDQWRTESERLGCSNPPPEIPKALQNRAKLDPIVKTVKKLLNLGRQHHKMFGKKAVKS